MRSKMSVLALAVMLVAAAATSALAAGQGWLGVTTQSIDADQRRELNLTLDGLLVTSVSAGSPVDKAGLEKGDVILSYNSRSVTEPEELRRLVRDTAPGRAVSLSVWRDGGRRTLEVKVGDTNDSGDDSFDTPVPRMAPMPDAPEPPAAPRAPRAPRERQRDDDGTVHRRMIVNGRELTDDEMDDYMKELDGETFMSPKDLKELKGLKDLKDIPGMRGWSSDDGSGWSFAPMGRGRLGVRVEKLTDDLAQALGVTGDEGVLVVQVLEDTPAQKAGVRAGDVIVRVGGESVSDPDGLVKALRGHDGGVNIVLLRKGMRRTIKAELDKARSGDGMFYGRNGKRFNIRIPEPGKTPQVYRWKAKDEAGSDEDLREELRQLRRELQELRRELGEKK